MNNFLRNAQFIFDNAGSVTIQSKDYCHFFENPKQAAEFINDIVLDTEVDVADWDGDEPEHRMQYNHTAEQNGDYRWLDWSDVRTIKNYTDSAAFGNIGIFCSNLKYV